MGNVAQYVLRAMCLSLEYQDVIFLQLNSDAVVTLLPRQNSVACIAN